MRQPSQGRSPAESADAQPPEPAMHAGQSAAAPRRTATALLAPGLPRRQQGGSQGTDGRSQSDLALAEDVGAQAALVDERPQQAGAAEPVEVDARLTEPEALAHDVADAEGAAHQGVDVDAAGEDVAPGSGEVDRDAGGGELVEDLGGHEGQVVAGARVAARGEGAGPGGVPVALETAPGHRLGDLEQLHVRLGGGCD